jgi:uncharacterized protein (DUF4415 family)
MNASTISPASEPVSQRDGDDLDEAPEWTADDFARATHRVGLQPAPGKKQKINIALDPDVVAWFKREAGPRGYQTLINAALREAMRGRQLEEVVRQAIREELRAR